ncbi:MAG: FAD-dependent oxidoreductase [Deltaproteobacteria bacterium]|nr:FAD-dependent oxidoreductase [Deltaproteobacteria bacterium]
MPSTGRYFHVPYGVVLPQKIENLLVAGRAVAGDKTSHAAIRQMMCCVVTGQGARRPLKRLVLGLNNPEYELNKMRIAAK